MSIVNCHDSLKEWQNRSVGCQHLQAARTSSQKTEGWGLCHLIGSTQVQPITLIRTCKTLRCKVTETPSVQEGLSKI